MLHLKQRLGMAMVVFVLCTVLPSLALADPPFGRHPGPHHGQGIHSPKPPHPNQGHFRGHAPGNRHDRYGHSEHSRRDGFGPAHAGERHRGDRGFNPHHPPRGREGFGHSPRPDNPHLHYNSNIKREHPQGRPDFGHGNAPRPPRGHR